MTSVAQTSTKTQGVADEDLIDDNGEVHPTPNEQVNGHGPVVTAIYKFANSGKLLFTGALSNLLLVAFLFSRIEPYSFHQSLYWGVTTMFTVGYGDISPESGAGMNLAMYTMVSMWLFVVLLTAWILIKLIINLDIFSDGEQKLLFRLLKKVVRKIDDCIISIKEQNAKIDKQNELLAQQNDVLGKVLDKLNEVDDEVDQLLLQNSPHDV
jgi:hypothetical protein